MQLQQRERTAKQRSALEAKLVQSICFHCDGLSEQDALVAAVGVLEYVADAAPAAAGGVTGEAVVRVIEDYAPGSFAEEEADELGEDVLRCLGVAPNLTAQAAEQEDDAAAPGLEPGVCAMCERVMPQTAHHLVPRTTWKKLRGRRMPEAWGLPADADKDTFEAFVHRTISICRACHSTIHATHDEVTLAQDYFTLPRLLEDPSIRKFVDWAARQKHNHATNAQMQRPRR